MLYKQLPNGLTAILKHEPNLKNAVINIFIQRGSSAETKEKTGMAHFLEHMMFEGSRNYPDFDLTLQKLLAENNAFTSQDYTNYYELVPNRHINAILQIERDRFEHLNWDKKKFQLQQSIILEEFKETSINPPLSDSWHYLLKLCFNNSYHWPVIGSKLSHISDFKIADLKKFYRQNYSAENITISIISNLPDKKALHLVENNFKDLKGTKPDLKISVANPKKTGKSKTVRRKNISSSHFFIAFHIEDFGSEEYFLADLISDLLTNGDSSILYRTLIVENQLCTEISSYTTDNRECNLLIIEGKLIPGIEYMEAEKEIIREVELLKRRGIPKLKFETIKNKAYTHWMFQLYSPTQLAHYLCLFKSRGIENPNELIRELYAKVDKVHIEDYMKQILDFNSSNRLVYIKA